MSDSFLALQQNLQDRITAINVACCLRCALLKCKPMSGLGRIDPAISRKLAKDIRAVAKSAHSEEDVRLNVEAALKPVLAQLGISTQASYEQPVTLLQGSGSLDAVYGFGIIEYKKPGIIAIPRGRKELIEQLSSYLAGKARDRAPTKPIEAA